MRQITDEQFEKLQLDIAKMATLRVRTGGGDGVDRMAEAKERLAMSNDIIRLLRSLPAPQSPPQQSEVEDKITIVQAYNISQARILELERQLEAAQRTPSAEKIGKVREYLEEIEQARGAYKIDPYEFAQSCIENMQNKARQALALLAETGE